MGFPRKLNYRPNFTAVFVQAKFNIAGGASRNTNYSVLELPTSHEPIFFLSPLFHKHISVSGLKAQTSLWNENRFPHARMPVFLTQPIAWGSCRIAPSFLLILF
uniref:Uncharacterized protein n=1 Tax=Cacopsylla melanoneura TaxID=428564 RepID=A0A8D8RJS3_9HEMI